MMTRMAVHHSVERIPRQATDPTKLLPLNKTSVAGHVSALTYKFIGVEYRAVTVTITPPYP